MILLLPCQESIKLFLVRGPPKWSNSLIMMKTQYSTLDDNQIQQQHCSLLSLVQYCQIMLMIPTLQDK